MGTPNTGQGTAVINGSVYNAGVITTDYLTINGSLTQIAGTTNLGGLTVAGGNGGSGLFSEIGGVVNIGTISPGGDLTATGGFIIGGSPGMPPPSTWVTPVPP